MIHGAPPEGTANTRQYSKDPDGRESVVHYPDYSAKHADEALEALVQSHRPDLDSRERERLLGEAKVLSTLSLRDKLDEFHATLKLIVNQSIETNAELSETIKAATNHVVVEMRKATVKAADNGSSGAEAA